MTPGEGGPRRADVARGLAPAIERGPRVRRPVGPVRGWSPGVNCRGREAPQLREEKYWGPAGARLRRGENPPFSSSASRRPRTAPTAPDGCSPVTAPATGCSRRCTGPGSRTSRRRCGRRRPGADGHPLVAAVRCAPPANKPTTDERDTCRPWLARELRRLWPRCGRSSCSAASAGPRCGRRCAPRVSRSRPAARVWAWRRSRRCRRPDRARLLPREPAEHLQTGRPDRADVGRCDASRGAARGLEAGVATRLSVLGWSGSDVFLHHVAHPDFVDGR